MENATISSEGMTLAHRPTSRLKRYIAGLFDTVLLFFIHYALYSLVLMTPIADQLHAHYEEMRMVRDEHKVSTGYGEKHFLSLEEYQADYSAYPLHEEQGEPIRYYVVMNVKFETTEERDRVYSEYEKATLADERYQFETTAYHIHNYLITAVLCGGVLEVIWFFVIPMIASCGATPGMLIAGIRLISSKHYGKPKWYQYLGRFGFIYVIESCFPYFFLAQWTLLLVPTIHIITIAITERHRDLHDIVSATMAVERLAYAEATSGGGDDIA